MKILFDAAGEPRALLVGQFLFDREGQPVCFVDGARVHSLKSGRYVGEIYQDMVVDPHTSDPGTLSPPVPPGRIPPPDVPAPRGRFDYGLPDRIDRLFED